MSPQEKKRNDKLVSIISLGLLVPFVVVVGYFLVTEIQLSSRINFIEPEIVEQGRPLTPAEVDAIRSDLPKTATTPTRIDSAVIVTEIDSTTAINTPVNQEPQNVSGSVSYSDKLVFKEATIEQLDTIADPVMQDVSGIVFAIESQKNSFTLVTSDDVTYEVVVPNTAMVLISGERISLNDLEIADFVRVEGRVSESIITAESVTITGTLEIKY